MNDAFHEIHARLAAWRERCATEREAVAVLEAQLAALLEAELTKARARLVKSDKAYAEVEAEMAELRPRLRFSLKLPDSVAISIHGQLGSAHRRAAVVSRSFRATVDAAKALEMFKVKVSIAVGGTYKSEYTVMCNPSGVHTFGNNSTLALGHGDGQGAALPRRVEGLTGKGVVGVSAGSLHTVAWTEVPNPPP